MNLLQTRGGNPLIQPACYSLHLCENKYKTSACKLEEIHSKLFINTVQQMYAS